MGNKVYGAGMHKGLEMGYKIAKKEFERNARNRNLLLELAKTVLNAIIKPKY